MYSTFSHKISQEHHWSTRMQQFKHFGRSRPMTQRLMHVSLHSAFSALAAWQKLKCCHGVAEEGSNCCALLGMVGYMFVWTSVNHPVNFHGSTWWKLPFRILLNCWKVSTQVSIWWMDSLHGFKLSFTLIDLVVGLQHVVWTTNWLEKRQRQRLISFCRASHFTNHFYVADAVFIECWPLLKHRFVNRTVDHRFEFLGPLATWRPSEGDRAAMPLTFGRLLRKTLKGS